MSYRRYVSSLTILFALTSFSPGTARANTPEQLKYHVTRNAVHGKVQASCPNGTQMLYRVVQVPQRVIDGAIQRQRLRNDQITGIFYTIKATVNGAVVATERYSIRGAKWQSMPISLRLSLQKSPTAKVVYTVEGHMELMAGGAAQGQAELKKGLHQVNGVDLSGDEMDYQMELQCDAMIE